MSNSTEKWKRGELEEGYYYVQTFNKIHDYYIIAPAFYNSFAKEFKNVGAYKQDDLTILSKVPSFEELQAKDDEIKKLKLHIANKTVDKKKFEQEVYENTTLKMKLKQAQNGLEFYADTRNWNNREDLSWYVINPISRDQKGNKARETLELIKEQKIVTEEENLKEMMKDPRYWRDRDSAYIKKIKEGFEKLYPNQQEQADEI